MRGFQSYGKKNHGMRPSRPREGRPKTKETIFVTLPSFRGPARLTRVRRAVQIGRGRLLAEFHGITSVFTRREWLIR